MLATRYASKPLPTAVPYELWCTTLNRQVDVGVLTKAALSFGSVAEQMDAASTLLRQLLEKEAVAFPSASSRVLPSVQHSWSVEYVGDADKQRANREVLDRIATSLLRFPDLGLQVHGLTGDVDEAPEALARFYGKRQREDVVELCTLLAKSRASTCMHELVRRGVSADRLVATAAARAGDARVQFFPQPLDQVKAKHAHAATQREADVNVARRAISSLLQAPGLVFNSEAEALRAPLGLAQAWSVDHLTPARSQSNRETLDGVARVVLTYPELWCELRGAAKPLDDAAAAAAAAAGGGVGGGGGGGGADGQRKRDLLAQNRAQACLDALVSRGAARSQLFVSTHSQPPTPGQAQGGDGVDVIAHAVGPKGRRGHVTDDVAEAFGRFDNQRFGAMAPADLPRALAQLGLSESRSASAAADAALRRYESRTAEIDLDEFGYLVAELRKLRAEASVVRPSFALLPTPLPSGYTYELRVRSDEPTLDGSAARVQNHDPAKPCSFETVSADGAHLEVRLALAPLSAGLTLRSELGRLSAGASGAVVSAADKPWYDGLATIPSVPFEVRHKRLNQVVATGTIGVPEKAALAHDGSLLVGEEYVVSTLEGAPFVASSTFTVRSPTAGEAGQEVVMRGGLREAKLTLAFESTSGQPLAPGIKYRIRSRRVAAHTAPLVQATTSRQGKPGIEELVSAQLSGGFLLHDQYVLEVEGSNVEGGVASQTKEFVMDSPSTRVVVRLLRRGPKASMVVRWHGPPAPASKQASATGDGDDAPLSAYSDVIEPIPFLLKDASSGKVLLAAAKATKAGSSDIGETGAFHASLFQGDEVTFETPASHGYAPSSTSTIVPYEAKFTVDVYLTRALQGYPTMPPQQPYPGYPPPPVPGSVAGGGTVRVAPAADQPAAMRLAPPPNLGFVITDAAAPPTATTYAYNPSQPPPGAYGGVPARVLTSGVFDASGGVGRIDESALVRGGQYKLELAHRPVNASSLIPVGDGDAAPCEPAHVIFAAGGDAPALTMRRRARPVRVLINASDALPNSSVASELLLEARHVAVPDVVVSSLRLASGSGDGDGGVRSGVLEGGLYIGEEYVLSARRAGTGAEEAARSAGSASAGAVTMHVTVVALPTPAGRLVEPQTVDFRTMAAAAAAAGPRWGDERPATVERSALVADAHRLHRALTSKSTADYPEVTDALYGKSVADLQALRQVWRETHPSKGELVTFVHSRGSRFRRGATRLEEMWMLSRSEVDARLIDEALNGGGKGGVTVDVMRVVEVLCTSMPHALVELRRAHRRTAGGAGLELKDALRTRLSQHYRHAGGSQSEDDSAFPLLAALLDGADEAARMSYTPELVARDVNALRAALLPPTSTGTSYDTVGGYAHVRDAALPVLTSRARPHLHAVAKAYESQYREPLAEMLSGRFGGDMRRATRLLLESSESYYAHKLHAALEGLERTPEIATVYDTKSLGRDTGGPLMGKTAAAAAGVGSSIHVDTVVGVVAGRFGRDLSGIMERWRGQYERSLAETVEQRATGELRRGLLAVLRSVPAPR